LAESENKRKKNQPQRNKNQLSSTLSSTVCLLCTLFEDLGCTIELHEKLANEVTELHSLDPRFFFLIDKEKKKIVLIIFLGKELSMKPVMMTKNIYRFMNYGVCLHTESSIKICLQFWMNSVYVHLEKRLVSQTDFTKLWFAQR
jgi:hypothetical protein